MPKLAQKKRRRMHCRRQPKIYLLVALLGIGLLARFLRYDGLGVAVRAHCLPVQGSHTSPSSAEGERRVAGLQEESGVRDQGGK